MMGRMEKTNRPSRIREIRKKSAPPKAAAMASIVPPRPEEEREDTSTEGRKKARSVARTVEPPPPATRTGLRPIRSDRVPMTGPANMAGKVSMEVYMPVRAGPRPRDEKRDRGRKKERGWGPRGG